MIPSFDDFGNLPPGIHRATLEEIEARFGRQSEDRRSQMDSIRWMIDLARRAGVTRIILNGSFVTAIIQPIDVDCVLLVPDESIRDVSAEMELLPFLDIAMAGREAFHHFLNVTFASDRYENPKGMIEVIL